MTSFALLFLFLVFGSSGNEERIAWSPERKLTWEDFKATADYDVPWAATTSSGISHGFSGNIKGDKVSFEYEVHCFFYPQNSWYKKELATENLLLHEQLHFDIAEIHARKLRKRIENFTFTTELKKEMNMLYERTNNEMKEMQRRYDGITEYSLDKERQKEWKAIVQAELKKLSAYKKGHQSVR